jgi:lipopolysaccharide export system protein LptC
MRTRQRADSTVGYTRFVRIMKVMLPIVALSLIVLVVVYSSAGRDNGTISINPTELNELTNDRELVNPKLSGTDGRGQPFTVTAKGASLEPGKARRMTIDDVKADITMQDKSWVQVGAVQGVLDVEGKTLDLKQTINIYSDRGYECHTNTARYDFGAGLLKGDNPISCQGPLGLITAKRFEGLRDPGILKFMGGVTTNYFPAARQGVAAEAAASNPEGIAEPVAEEESDVFVPAETKPGAATPTKPKPNSATP